MHTKIAVHANSNRGTRYFAKNSVALSKKTVNTAGLESLFDDSWIDEEATKRDSLLIKRLCSSMKAFLQHNDTGILLSYCPGLPQRISEEIARISRDEPGGMAAGRVSLNIVSNESFTSLPDSFGAESENKPASLSLGKTSLSDAKMIETFEIQVYLFPSNSVLSKLQSIVTSLRQKDASKHSRSRNISLLPDFILTKRKLFRSNNNKPFVVIKSLAK